MVETVKQAFSLRLRVYYSFVWRFILFFVLMYLSVLLYTSLTTLSLYLIYSICDFYFKGWSADFFLNLTLAAAVASFVVAHIMSYVIVFPASYFAIKGVLVKDYDDFSVRLVDYADNLVAKYNIRLFIKMLFSKSGFAFFALPYLIYFLLFVNSQYTLIELPPLMLFELLLITIMLFALLYPLFISFLKGKYNHMHIAFIHRSEHFLRLTFWEKMSKYINWHYTRRFLISVLIIFFIVGSYFYTMIGVKTNLRFVYFYETSDGFIELYKRPMGRSIDLGSMELISCFKRKDYIVLFGTERRDVIDARGLKSVSVVALGLAGNDVMLGTRNMDYIVDLWNKTLMVGCSDNDSLIFDNKRDIVLNSVDGNSNPSEEDLDLYGGCTLNSLESQLDKMSRKVPRYLKKFLQIGKYQAETL